MREAPEKSPRQEPDLTICRTSPVTAPWLEHQPFISNCLVEKKDCRYALTFAYGCLCKHPRHLELSVQHTQPPPFCRSAGTPPGSAAS